MNELLLGQIQELLVTSELPELGPGPRPGVRSQTELETELRPLLQAAGLPRVTGDLIRSLVMLWHDHLDTSHTISQGIENPDGSLLHAIMHRREPDFWNSKYWWRRVGQHPCFTQLAGQAAKLLEARADTSTSKRWMARGDWDPFAFVDACEAASRLPATSSEVQLLRESQKIESEAALVYFLRGHE